MLFAVAVVISLLKLLLPKKNPLHDACFAAYAKRLVPYIAMSALICAWFSLGDGAPPNDRYGTLCLVVCNLWIYVVFMKA